MYQPSFDFKVAASALLMITVLVGLAAVAVQSRPIAEGPNFIIILADDMGYSDLGYFGGGSQTQNLDTLAHNGLTFTQFYNSTRCWPSRASLMTGLYPHQAHGAMLWGSDAPPAYQGVSKEFAWLISEVLNAHGYATYHAGKWHLDGLPGNTPLERGFERSYWTPTQDNYFNPRYIVDEGKTIKRPGANGDFYVTDEIGRRASAYLTDHFASDDRPFFLYLAFTAPHFPLHAPINSIQKYVESVSSGWDELRKRRYSKLRKKGLVSCIDLSARDESAVAWNSLTNAEKEDQIMRMATHLAMIDHMDRAVGQVIETLRRNQALDNTVIFFLSDNGASAERVIRGDGHDSNAVAGSANTYKTLQVGWSNAANTPFRGHKIFTKEGGISTPLVVYWPAGLNEMRGETTAQVGHLIDLVPTILDIAKIPESTSKEAGTSVPLPGISLLRNIRDGTVQERTLFWEHVGNKALRHGDWKLVADYSRPYELYNLAVDRCEMHNLAKEEPQLLNQLIERWEQEAESQGVVPHERFPSAQYVPTPEYRQK